MCLRTAEQLEAHEQLEADHLPSSWARTHAHKPVRLEDIDVVCNKCNVERGPSGPGSQRYEEWQESQ